MDSELFEDTSAIIFELHIMEIVIE